MKRYLLICAWLLTAGASNLCAQNTPIHGTVSDAVTGRPIAGARVQVKDELLVSLTDTAGSFSFFISVRAGTLMVSYDGYTPKEILVLGDETDVNIALRPFNIPLRQTVYMPLRETAPIEQSPVEVEKTNGQQIESSPTADFYQDLGALGGVDVVTSSVFFKTINMNGFADTRQLRVKQFIDGADNEAPGFNAPIGNMNGANDLDLESVEISPGPASALYGSGAMQGVVAINSKSPYDYKGLSLQILDGGTTAPGSYFDAQLRYANTFGRQGRLGLKITGEFTQMNEWPTGNDSLYGNTKDDVNLNAFIQNEAMAPYCPTCPVTTAQHNYYTTVANWLTTNPAATNFDPANPKNGFVNIQSPGYVPSALTDNNPQNGKLLAGLYYRFNNQIELSGTYRASYGSAIYPTASPYQLKNFFFQQPMLQIKGKDFFVRLYGSFENAEQSYNISAAANALSGSAGAAYISKFSDSYFNTIDTLVGGFANCANCITGNQWVIDSARNVARYTAQTAWYTPGTQTFNDTFHSIISDRSRARFYDRSALVHLDAQYNWDFIKWLDIITGVSYRVYMPNSAGTYLQDTSGAIIREVDVNAFAQITKKLFNDRFVITAAVNVDNSSNFKPQLSPRGALIYTARAKHSSHTFRLSAATGFRNPSIQEQYLRFNTGSVEQMGNLYGLDNLYTVNSVNNALGIYNHAPGNSDTINAAQQALVPLTLAALKPESVTSFEFEYRAEIRNRVLIDLSAHYNLYNDLIGLARVVSPTANGLAGDSSSANAVLAGYYTPIQTWANTTGQIPAWGAAISIACYAGAGITPYINYTYSDLDEKSLPNSENIMLAGFNMPKHKLNIGINGSHVCGGLGFSVNWSWQTAYQWDGWFYNGQIPSYHTLDIQVYYQFEKAHSTIRLGGSNIYNNVHIEAAGAPQIGAVYYAGWLFDFTNKMKKAK